MIASIIAEKNFLTISIFKLHKEVKREQNMQTKTINHNSIFLILIDRYI